MIRINPEKFSKEFKKTIKIDLSKIDVNKIKLKSLRENYADILESIIYEDFFKDDYQYNKFILEYISLCRFIKTKLPNMKVKKEEKINNRMLTLRYIKNIEEVRELSNCSNDDEYKKFCANKDNYEYLRAEIIKIVESINGRREDGRKKKNRTQLKGLIDDIKLEIDGKVKKFDYSSLSSTIKTNYINALGVKVCPYCNSSYIEPIKTINIHDIDHFLPSSVFPLFCLSLYNFVPSCKNCNETLKGDDCEKELVNPNIEGFCNDMTFFVRQSPENTRYLIDFEKNCDEEKVKRCNNNVELFQLKNRYENRQDLIKHMVNFKENNPDCIIKQKIKMYADNGINFGLKDILNEAFKMNLEESEDLTIPDAKFTRDIYNNYDKYSK